MIKPGQASLHGCQILSWTEAHPCRGCRPDTPRRKRCARKMPVSCHTNQSLSSTKRSASWYISGASSSSSSALDNMNAGETAPPHRSSHFSPRFTAASVKRSACACAELCFHSLGQAWGYPFQRGRNDKGVPSLFTGSTLQPVVSMPRPPIRELSTSLTTALTASVIESSQSWGCCNAHCGASETPFSGRHRSITPCRYDSIAVASTVPVSASTTWARTDSVPKSKPITSMVTYTVQGREIIDVL